MKIFLKIIVHFFEFLKYISMLFVCIYIFSWVALILNKNFFNKINVHFHTVPDYFDNLCHYEVILQGEDVKMGYAVAAAFCVILFFIFSFLINITDKLEKNIEIKVKEFKIKKYSEEYIKRLNIEPKPDPEGFCGLFELIYTNLNSEEIDVNKLKHDSCEMIIEKLKLKHSNIKFTILSDNIFIKCNNFSQFNILIDELIKLYNTLNNFNKNKFIKTDLLFSLWSQSGAINSQTSKNFLIEINKLNFTNKIILNDEMYHYLKKIEIENFDFQPMGATKLFNVLNDGEDKEIGLYRLIKKQEA